jgi:hypothetical protein
LNEYHLDNTSICLVRRVGRSWEIDRTMWWRMRLFPASAVVRPETLYCCTNFFFFPTLHLFPCCQTWLVSTSPCATDEISPVSVYSYLFAYFCLVSPCQQGLGNWPHNGWRMRLLPVSAVVRPVSLYWCLSVFRSSAFMWAGEIRMVHPSLVRRMRSFWFLTHSVWSYSWLAMRHDMLYPHSRIIVTFKLQHLPPELLFTPIHLHTVILFKLDLAINTKWQYFRWELRL